MPTSADSTPELAGMIRDGNSVRKAHDSFGTPSEATSQSSDGEREDPDEDREQQQHAEADVGEALARPWRAG